MTNSSGKHKMVAKFERGLYAAMPWRIMAYRSIDKEHQQLT